MKYLVLVEGKNELVLVQYLISNNLLLIDKKDMIDDQPHVLRQLNDRKELSRKLLTYICMLDIEDEVIILRIGDTLKDKLKIPSSIKSRIKM